MAAREIALAFGVPPLLLGLPGDNTYANYAEANRAFWRGSVLPLVNRTLGSLAHWLTPSFGEGFRLEPDLMTGSRRDMCRPSAPRSGRESMRRAS